MQDFLLFKKFISIDILIISYYIGAIFIPILMLVAKSYLQYKIKLFDRFNRVFNRLFGSMSLSKKILFILFMVIMFISMEIIWRMMFEAMIGYFQMIENSFK